MSTLLRVNNLCKSYGPRVILDDANLTISEKQKVGVIGRNGAGKSTLFNIIVDEEETSSGEVIIHDNTRLGYLTQHDTFAPYDTVIDFLMRSSQKEEWQCAKMAATFHIKNDMLQKEIGSLAGGFQMRVKLASMLLLEPNLLLLDEPTNYLDLSTLLLLEQFLQSYRGSFLLISHDREFLKKTCTQTIEVDQGKTVLYPGPLEEYLAYKEDQIEMTKRYNKKIAREQRHLQTFVDRFRYKASKATQAQSKLKQLDRLKTIDIAHPMRTARIRIPDVIEKKGIGLSTNDLSIGYPEKTIAEHISLTIDRGEHIAIVGDNGQGKTTFLKTISEELAPLAGTFRWGVNMDVGYYAQHVPLMLVPTEQVGKYLERVAAPDVKGNDILEMASNFLFRGDDVKKTVAMLSGGEKARLCLAGLLLQKNHVLLLDEPTNHLDFETVEALAVALQACNSTILFVSHNRTFVNMLATGIIEVRNKKVKRYLHNYEEYVYHLGRDMGDERAGSESPVLKKGIPLDKEKRRELYEELKQEKNQLRTFEHDIAELEKEKLELMAWFKKNTKEYSREKTEELAAVTQLIEKKEAEWLVCQEKMAALEGLRGSAGDV